MTDEELLQGIEEQRNLMVSVATGGPRIDSVNQDYIRRRGVIAQALGARRIQDPNPHRDLWAWHGKWSSGDLPSYQSRRSYLTEMYGPLLDRLRSSSQGPLPEPTGWAKVDRGIDGARSRLATASNEEEFQTVGFLCREALISLGQELYDPQRHPSPDDETPSSTDAARMLGAYLSATLGGASAETLRRHAKSALSLAVELQHKRTALFRDAALCAEATSAVVNILAIVAGRRDPAPE